MARRVVVARCLVRHCSRRESQEVFKKRQQNKGLRWRKAEPDGWFYMTKARVKVPELTRSTNGGEGGHGPFTKSKVQRAPRNIMLDALLVLVLTGSFVHETTQLSHHHVDATQGGVCPQPA